jgi:hypothetical protein
MNYTGSATDPHWREEELQWASILSTGDAARGMALLFLQKMCAAFHEFEPAFAAGAIDETKVGLFRGRLASRTKMLIAAMQANNLDTLDGFADLTDVLSAVESADSTGALADLTDTVHDLGHKLCDSLERTD